MDNLLLKRLNCGINVCLDLNKSVNSCAIGIFVNSGPIDEDSNTYGLSHFIEHMMFKGTTLRNANKIALDFDNIGAEINAYTSLEHTCYYIKTISENLYIALDSFFDMLNNSTFDSSEIECERKVIFEEMNMSNDEVDDLCHDTINSLIFKNSSYENPILGYKGNIASYNRNDLISFKEKNYIKSNIFVSVSGNFDIKKLCDYLETQFYGINDGPINRKIYLSDYTKRDIVIHKDIEQTHISLAKRAYSFSKIEKYYLMFMNEILGGGMSSRLFQNIRENKGLCYNIYSFHQAYKETGIFEIYCGISHDNINDVFKALKKEIDCIRNYGISEDEFNKAYVQLKSSILFSQESILSRMFSNGRAFLNLNKLFTYEDSLNILNSITYQEVCDFSKEYFNYDDFSSCIVTRK